MPLRHAIIEATVPSANGTVDYTSPNITDWSAGGIALIFVSGDTSALTSDGLLSVGMVNQAGNQFTTSWRAHAGVAGTAECRETSLNDQAIAIINNTAGTALGVWARATFSSALTNGVRLSWDDTAGIGAKVLKIVVVLIEGFTGTFITGTHPQSNAVFTPEALVGFSNGNGTFAAFQQTARSNQEVNPGLGACRFSDLAQASAEVCWDRGADPTEARGSRYTTKFIASADGVTERAETVTAATATSYTSTGTGRGLYAQLRTGNGGAEFAVARETLSGTTGTLSFTGLGKRCGLVIGFLCGLTSDATFETDRAADSWATFFILDRSSVYSIGFAQLHNGVTIDAGHPTQAYSCYSSSSIRAIDDTNATAFQATSAGITATGIDLAVTTGMTGTMLLVGFATNPSQTIRRRGRRARRVARSRLRRRAPLVGGKPVGQPPLNRGFWKAIGRIRRAAQARLRRVLPPFYGVRFTGQATDEGEKGRVFTPGLARGKITWVGNFPDDEQ